MAFVNLYQNVTRDTRLQLGGDELVLPMTFGNNWVRLSLGVRFTVLVPAVTTSSILNGTFAFGVTNRQSGYARSSCTGWVGCDSLFGTITYVAVANNPGYYSVTYMRYGSKVNDTATMTNTTTSGPYAVLMRYPVHGAWLLDITRPSYLSTTYAIQPRCTAVASASVDMTYYNFIEACRNYSTPGGYFFTSAVGAGVSGYTGTTVLDAVSVYWNHCVPVVEISDVVALRIM